MDEATLTWEKFKQRFESKFLPKAEKAAMAQKFIDLKQGQMSIAEYVAAFESLSNYGLELVNTPTKKNQKFVYGLNKSLRKPLLTLLDCSFKKLVDTALRLEEVEHDSGDGAQRGKPDFMLKRKFPYYKKSGNFQNMQVKTRMAEPKSQPKDHVDCFNYGEHGHYSRECTKPRVPMSQMSA